MKSKIKYREKLKNSTKKIIYEKLDMLSEDTINNILDNMSIKEMKKLKKSLKIYRGVKTNE